LGLPEVIGVTFRSFPLRRREQRLEYPLDLISRLKDFGMTTQAAHSLIFWTHCSKSRIEQTRFAVVPIRTRFAAVSNCRTIAIYEYTPLAAR
jgi:hypothetical protein